MNPILTILLVLLSGLGLWFFNLNRGNKLARLSNVFMAVGIWVYLVLSSQLAGDNSPTVYGAFVFLLFVSTIFHVIFIGKSDMKRVTKLSVITVCFLVIAHYYLILGGLPYYSESFVIRATLILILSMGVLNNSQQLKRENRNTGLYYALFVVEIIARFI